jgi:hypothetical protein
MSLRDKIIIALGGCTEAVAIEIVNEYIHEEREEAVKEYRQSHPIFDELQGKTCNHLSDGSDPLFQFYNNRLCTLCGVTFGSETGLNYHLKKHGGK